MRHDVKLFPLTSCRISCIILSVKQKRLTARMREKGAPAVKDLQRYTLLIDFYGQLLTPRQQELIAAYYLEDLSLGEIAGEDGVSRQAVHDLIKRSEAALAEFEAKLGMVAEYLQRQERLAQVRSLLEGARGSGVPEAVRLLEQMLEEKGEAYTAPDRGDPDGSVREPER